jgi:virginiamycin B lyase
MNTGGVALDYTVPTSNGHPTSIVAGPDHHYWFIESPVPAPFAPEPRIGRISTLGTFVDFTVDLKNGLPGSIAVGPDGNIWFTSPQEGLIRSITTSGKLTKVRIPAETPAGIALGPDGAVWFTEQPNGIGRIEVPKRRG